MNAGRSIRYSTAILEYPSKRFGFVGAIPACFSNETYLTEEEAIKDLLSIGLTKFQKSDCSFYDETGKTINDL